MRLWRRQSPFSIDGHFAERLHDGWTTESEFRRLLGIRAETLHVHADTPAWLTTLAAAYARSPVRRGDAAAASGTPAFQARRFPERGRTARQRGLRPAARRDAAAARERIALRVRPGHDRAALARVSSGRAASGAQPHAGAGAEHGARGRAAEGSTPKSGSRRFVTGLRQPKQALEVLLAYPVLARQAVGCVDNWAANSLEFLRHLSADWHRHPGDVLRRRRSRAARLRRGQPGRSASRRPFRAARQVRVGLRGGLQTPIPGGRRALPTAPYVAERPRRAAGLPDAGHRRPARSRLGRVRSPEQLHVDGRSRAFLSAARRLPRRALRAGGDRLSLRERHRVGRAPRAARSGRAVSSTNRRRRRPFRSAGHGGAGAIGHARRAAARAHLVDRNPGRHRHQRDWRRWAANCRPMSFPNGKASAPTPCGSPASTSPFPKA